MKRNVGKVVEYLPFLGIVAVICTASWLAGRSSLVSRPSLVRSPVRR
ncbi:hypothetical protein ACIBP6_23805 [Nonomuraea terrae]|nr:hypothetical protein [Nonomuraea terrae]